MDDVALRLRGVSLLGDDDRAIVDDVDWEVARGGTGVIVGASGSGKSRLLRLVNRLDERAAGSIEVLGRDIDDWDVAELRRAVAWVPQRPALVPGRASDVLEVPARIGSVDRDDADARMDEAREVAGIDDALCARKVEALSGGERLRLALARALLLAPEILLLDEPTSSLDGATAAALLERVARWRERHGATLVVVTHRERDVRALGGALLVLDDGGVQAAGPVAELLDDPDVRHLMTGEEPS